MLIDVLAHIQFTKARPIFASSVLFAIHIRHYKTYRSEIFQFCTISRTFLKTAVPPQQRRHNTQTGYANMLFCAG
jgi:hypothetical protein